MSLCVAQIAFLSFTLSGLVCCFLILAAGFLLGTWNSKRRQFFKDQHHAKEERVLEMLGGMSSWTGDVAGDVSKFGGMIRQLNDKVLSISTGRNNGLDDSTIELLSQMMTANEETRDRLINAEQSLIEKAEEVAEYLNEARTDALTTLQNRRAFDDEITRRFAEKKRYDSTCSLIVLDIDHFKQFNDLHGHLAGDEVLRSVARTLNDLFRDSDVSFRFGGEEFAIILPASDLKKGALAAVRFRDVIEKEAVSYDGKSLKVTVSCGVAEMKFDDTELTLIDRADEALYSSKRGGRNCVSVNDGVRIRQISKEGDLSQEVRIPRELSAVCDDLRDRLMQVTVKK